MKTKLQIEQHYASLTVTEKEVANYVMSKKGYNIKSMTLAELSKELKIGEASIVRFCRKVGFSGFQDLKLSLSLDIVRENEVKEESLKGRTTILDSMNKVLKSTSKAIISEDVKKATNMIIDSNNLYFYGIGSSGIAAEMAEDRFLRLGCKCKSVRDFHNQVIQASLTDEKDIIVAISLSGSSEELYKSLLIAKKNNCKIIVITNHPESVIGLLGDVILQTAGFESLVTGGTFSSVVSQLFTLDVLYSSYEKHANKDHITSKETVAKELLKARESFK